MHVIQKISAHLKMLNKKVSFDQSLQKIYEKNGGNLNFFKHRNFQMLLYALKHMKLLLHLFKDICI